jgi:hypothetical protein
MGSTWTVESGIVSVYDRSGHVVSVLSGDAAQSGPYCLIATFGEERPTEVWVWRRKRLIAALPVSAERAVFDPSGERIATDDLEIWDVASEKLSLRLPYSRERFDVALASSPDGTRLAASSADELRVCSVRDRAKSYWCCPIEGRSKSKGSCSVRRLDARFKAG